jgi:hypothetical protein
VGISLVCGELVEARGLAVVLGQATPTVPIEVGEIVLRVGISLVCGELVEARGLAVVLRQTAPTAHIDLGGLVDCLLTLSQLGVDIYISITSLS